MYNEAMLLAALPESEARAEFYKSRTMELQAANILNKAYCKTMQEQLEFQEKKKQRRGKGKLLGDGLPVLLSGDAFFQRVAELKMVRESIQVAMVEYRKQVEQRKQWIAVRQSQWEEEQWGADKAAAKTMKQKFNQPKLLLGRLPQQSQSLMHVWNYMLMAETKQHNVSSLSMLID
ncbi:hypothetical protein EVJ58_g2863 [Rhodofomes roseus]|uniref:Uncharacterized protein n=1 Tax=Rhodofomes roseus TaxID=34475 RepID=A0A4Y9YQI3_9APHY|nr:hypothetical protein EVJ58_g2863 [Rhodofomes roseus]